MMYFFIYKTTCLTTKRFYIGVHKTSNIEDGYLGSGLVLKRSIKKYGKDKHIRKILGFFDNLEKAYETEKKIVTELLLKNKLCMNLKNGGCGGFDHIKHTPSNKIIYGSRGGKTFWENTKNNKDLLEKHIKESGERLSKLHKLKKISPPSWVGKIHKEETKQLMSEKATSRLKVKSNNNMYGKCWIHNLVLLENKVVQKDELQKWLKDGWKSGRKMNLHK